MGIHRHCLAGTNHETKENPSMTSTRKTSEWTPVTTKLPPAGEIVMTKIDDERGVRNEAPLKRDGNLWFLADGSMYVYYSPTHWQHRD
jgi:hypothetical protein